MIAATQQPIVMALNDPTRFQLWQTFGYAWTETGTDYLFTIRAGFVFFPSVPRLFWTAAGIAPSNLGTLGPMYHDFLYTYSGNPATATATAGLLTEKPAGGHDSMWTPSVRIWTRKQADTFFYNLMLDAGISKWTATKAYYGVRAGGGFSWGTT